MKRISRFAALAAAAAIGAVGITPRGAFHETQVQQQSSRGNKENAPAPTPTAKPGQTVSAETLGGFTVRAESRREPIWVGYPRGAAGRAGFPFRRIKGQKWSPRA